MQQVIQDIRNGRTLVKTLPDPIAQPRTIIVETRYSLLSAGTERSVLDLAKKSLLGKALDRPEQVRRVLQKVKQEGLRSTTSQVRAKLGEPLALGYSASGVVREVGSGVEDFSPGDAVATVSPHAGVVSVGRNLCARIPDGVPLECATYTSVASIALQGVRLAKLGLGDRVLVVGLGLVGSIAVALLKAQGCTVFGMDIDESRLRLGQDFGASSTSTTLTSEQATDFTGGAGFDAVLLTTATTSNSPLELAAEVTRRKARIVLVGVAGTDIPREPFFRKELEFTVSGSLGPGRWDTSYEEKGLDYPLGHVRWPLRRNMETALAAMKRGELPVEKLTTHRFPVTRAADAYSLLSERTEPYIGILLSYSSGSSETKLARVDLGSTSKKAHGKVCVSVIGAGNFARLVLLPHLNAASNVRLRGICSGRGLSAVDLGEKLDFAFATTDAEAILEDPSTNAVVILTRHDLHSELVIRALRAGKHVFVEKPLALSAAELDAVHACVEELGSECPVLMVGYNRRFAPATGATRSMFSGTAPLSMHVRFLTSQLPVSSWVRDPSSGGGRVIGEACHAIDICTAIIGSPPVRIFAEAVGAGRDRGERLVMTMKHRNGGLSTISYDSGGDRGGPKERVEVLGGGRTAVIEDWRQVDLWHRGKRQRVKAPGKGHIEEISAFVAAVSSGGPWPISWEDQWSTSWASFAAVQSLADGYPVDW